MARRYLTIELLIAQLQALVRTGAALNTPVVVPAPDHSYRFPSLHLEDVEEDGADIFEPNDPNAPTGQAVVIS